MTTGRRIGRKLQRVVEEVQERIAEQIRIAAERHRLSCVARCVRLQSARGAARHASTQAIEREACARCEQVFGVRRGRPAAGRRPRVSVGRLALRSSREIRRDRRGERVGIGAHRGRVGFDRRDRCLELVRNGGDDLVLELLDCGKAHFAAERNEPAVVDIERSVACSSRGADRPALESTIGSGTTARPSGGSMRCKEFIERFPDRVRARNAR